MTLCLFLRPEDRIQELAENYAEKLSLLVPTDLKLGHNAVDHITLAHFEGIDEKADELWAMAIDELDEAYEINGPFYMSVIPFPDGSGHNFVRLEVSRSDALDRAQRRVIRLGEHLGGKVTNLAGHAWRPHVTVAVIDALPTQLPQIEEIINGDSWWAMPAMGRIGRHRHVDQVIHGRR